MKRSGLEDPEQQLLIQMHEPRHHLHDLQNPEIDGSSDHCMQQEEEMQKKELSPVLHSQFIGRDRLEGEVLISKRQQVFEEAASDRHSCLAEGRGPKRLEWTALEAFRERLEPTQRPELVRAKLAEKLSDAGMGLNSTSDLKLSGNLSRACRICNKQFPSGRALGGHMRVHGPLFAPASGALSRSYGVGPAAENLTHRENANDYHARNEEEDDGTAPSITDSALDAGELEEDSHLQGARSAQASSRHGTDGTVILDRYNGYGDVELDAHHADGDEEKDLNSVEGRFFSLVNHLDGTTEEARIEANSIESRKSLLYKLRHNPKRSRWFADQEFAFDASMANLSGKNPPLITEGGSVCSECGKSFLSERALFGHMRCHPDRDRRVVLTPVDGMNSKQPLDTMARQRRKLRLLAADKFMQGSEMQIGFAEVYKTEAAEVEAPMATRYEALPASARIGVIGSEELADKRVAAEVLEADKEQHGRISSISSRIMNDKVAPARWQRAGRRSRRKVGSSKAGTMELRATSSSSPEDEPALTSETISVELGVEEQEIETPDFLILLADAARKIEEETELLLSLEKSSHLCADEQRSKHRRMDAADRHPHIEDVLGNEHEDAPQVHDRLVTGTSIAKYECTTCNKSFNSHQALGGHRASHKKTKGCFARTGSSEASEEHSLEEELELSHVQEKSRMITHKRNRSQTQQGAAFKGHACSICHRIFLTGQALGGHKRCHWTGEKPSEAATSIASTTNKQFSLQSEGQSMVEGGIDLNMPAPLDEDTDEVGYVSTEMQSINGEIADQETEVEKLNGAGSDLALGTSPLSWAVKDLLKDDTCRASPQKETEVRRRFDGIWGQHWPNNIGVTQLHQAMYAMESLV